MTKKIVLLLLLFIFEIKISFGQKSKQPNYKAIATQLRTIDSLDVSIRNNINEYMQSKSYSRYSERSRVLSDSMAYIDSCNLYFVDSILKNYGWLSDKQVGKLGQNAIFLVVQHSGKKYELSIRKKIKKWYRKGLVRPTYYALLIDRIRVFQHKKQLFGTQARAYNHKYFIMPCKRVKTLDKRRKKWG